MKRLYCDFHMHSCLSPCGDNDMTPANIAGMAFLKGLGAVALTDHNSAKNCPAFFAACEEAGILPIAGMEMTAAEEVHLVALFPTLESALAYDAFLQDKRVLIKNREDIFGEQRIMDAQDNIIGHEEHLLINALTMDVAECTQTARAYGALVYPAHIDKDANSIITALGFMPEDPTFTCYEFHSREKIDPFREKYSLGSARALISSDAHYLWDINESDQAMTIDVDETWDDDTKRAKILEMFQ